MSKFHGTGSISLGDIPFIADSFKSLEQGFTVLRLGNKKISTEIENFNLKENGKLKYSCFKLCLLAFKISIKTI